MSYSTPSTPGGRDHAGADLRAAYQRAARAAMPARERARRPFISRRLMRAGVAILAVLVIIAIVALWAIYRASQQVPEFYQRAVVVAPAKQAEAGRQLERQAAALHNQARQPGRWEARFTQEQLNGWLASDLPQKFPGSMPKGVSDPRVAITAEEAQLAVKWEDTGIATVVSLVGSVQLTDQPNEVAVRIFTARAGAIPVPLGQFLEQIAGRAAASGIPLRWTEMEGDPVAIINLPLDQTEFRGKQIVVEDLRLETGEIVVSGRTEIADELGPGGGP